MGCQLKNTLYGVCDVCVVWGLGFGGLVEVEESSAAQLVAVGELLRADAFCLGAMIWGSSDQLIVIAGQWSGSRVGAFLAHPLLLQGGKGASCCSCTCKLSAAYQGSFQIAASIICHGNASRRQMEWMFHLSRRFLLSLKH